MLEIVFCSSALTLMLADIFQYLGAGLEKVLGSWESEGEKEGKKEGKKEGEKCGGKV